MARRSHIIGKQILDVEIDVGEDFFALQQDVSRVFHARVTPALDALFSRYVGAETVVRLDRLEVDLGRINRFRLEDDLAARLVEALEPMLAAQLGGVAPAARRASSSARAARRRSGAEGAFQARDEDASEAWFARQDRAEEDDFTQHSLEGHTIELWHYFLKNGHVPWWAPALEPSEFETQVLEALEAQPALLAQTRAVVQQSPVALRRLVLQFSDAFLDRLVRAYAQALSPRLLRVVQDFARWLAEHPAAEIAPRAFRQAFWPEALQEIFAGSPQDADHAERAVVRRALRRLSRRVSVDYPVFLARLHAVFREEEPEAASGPVPFIRPLVEALASAARPAEAAASEVAQSAEAVAPEETSRPEPAAPSKTPSEAERPLEPAAPVDQPSAVTEEAVLPEEEAAARAERDAPVVRSEPEAMEERVSPEPVREGTELYLRNAGLVLLHPYLPAHFEHLGLVKDKAFVDEGARQKAIYQLQHLATGDEQEPEYSLTLNKLLCGHPLEQPLARDTVLSEAERAEAENLLKAVICNWPALKNTSPDGLREGFLLREGKLTRNPFDWLLQVEQKTLDILLGRLPWGLSLIKLPWMPEMLRVEWA